MKKRNHLVHKFDTLLSINHRLPKIKDSGFNSFLNLDELLDQLENERDSDRRADIIRKLGDSPEPKVIKTLWDLRNNLEKEDDSFVQYEIKLTLHKVTSHPDINIDFFLENLEVFQLKESASQTPKFLIDGDLILEFLLREKTNLSRDATKVVELILNGKINPHIGKNGLKSIWSYVTELKGREYANRLVLELLSKFEICERDLGEVEIEKLPTVNIKTIVQIEIARSKGLDGIITLRDRDFIGSGYPSVYSSAQISQLVEDSQDIELSPEFIKEKCKNFSKFSVECNREKVTKILQIENEQKLNFEEKLILSQGWKIEKFEILCSHNYLTSATVIICNQDGSIRYQESAFKKGSINALFTAFDQAFSRLFKIEHTLESIYVANLEPGKEGSVTAKAIVKSGTKEFIAIYTHENIIKAYLFAYVQAVTAVYAPNEYQPARHNEKELMALYTIGTRDFHQVNFSQVNFMDIDANLSGAKLRECNFSNANLSGVNFANADLTGADLSHANLSHADLTGADLTDIKLDESNQTLFDGTILTNAIMPEIKIEINGESRLEKVARLLEKIDYPSQYQISAIHSMTDFIWWHTLSGQEFFEAQKKWIQKGMIIKRVFIFPQNPKPEHLQVLQEQQKSGIEVYYICHDSAKNIDQYDCHDLNLLICENRNPNFERNIFTTQMFINEPEQKGYISYKLEDIKTNKQRFSFILGKAELFDGNKPLCALTEFSIKNKKAFFA
jgi:uncharacterized protein YjbI with pentapeptide repeats